MNGNEPQSEDDQFSLILAECDQALAEGVAHKVLAKADDPPELRERLARDLACLQRLQCLRPRQQKVNPNNAGPPLLFHREPFENTDQNLLFGVLALQADMIDSAQFVEACTLWSTRKHTPLADLLVERGWLTSSDRADVGKLLERKLHKHAGDARASLAAVAGEAVRHALAALQDVAIRESVTSLPNSSRQGLACTIDYMPQSRQRYILTGLHGKGGIGQVWLAHDADLGRNVALKELRPDRAENPAIVERFLHEAKITGQLEHPGIVPIYEMSHRGNAVSLGRAPADSSPSGFSTSESKSKETAQPFYTMRFIRGRTLTKAIQTYHQKKKSGKAGTLALVELVTAFVNVCQALAYAHSRGVIHRDLKGENVVLGDFGEVIVIDWGFAKVLEPGASDPLSIVPTEARDDTRLPSAIHWTSDGEHQTLQGQIVGTPAFMSPEQAGGRLDDLDRRTDVYGLGAILYELLTGRPPFVGSDVQEVLRQVREEQPQRPRYACAGVPPGLEAVCLRALAKKPEHRYSSADELAREVKRWLADEPPRAYREPILAWFGRWARRHKPHVAGLTVLLLTGVISALVIRQNNAINTEREISLSLQAEIQKKAKEDVERSGYLKFVTMAEPEMSEGRAGRADELLEASKKLGEPRWEWHYLHGRTHRCVLTLRGHDKPVVSVLYSPDGKQIAAGCDKTAIVKIWDSSTGKLLPPLDGQVGEGLAKMLAYSPDSRLLAVAKYGDEKADALRVEIWDAITGKLRYRLPGTGSQIVDGVAFSPDGQQIATPIGNTLKFWDASTGKPSHEFPFPFSLHRVEYSPDGEFLAITERNEPLGGRFQIVKSKTFEPVYDLQGHASMVSWFKFSPNGQFLVSCGREDRKVIIWDMTTGKAKHEISAAHTSEQLSVDVSPDSKLVASASLDGTFKVWDAESGQLLRTFSGHANFVSAVAFSPDGKHLASCSWDKTVKVWDITNLTNGGPKAAELQAHAASVHAVTFSPNGELFVSASADHTIKVWDTRSLREIKVLTGHTSDVLCVAFHPNGQSLASASADGTVKLWNLNDQACLTLQGHSGPLRSMAFSTDGQRLISVGDGDSVRAWNVTFGLAMPEVFHKDTVHIHCLSRFGDRLVATVMDGTNGKDERLSLRDTLKGDEIRPLRSRTDSVSCATFSRDGRYLGWAEKDLTVRIVDTEGKVNAPKGIDAELASLDLKGHTQTITSLAFIYDRGSDPVRLVSVSEDKTLRLWDISQLETHIGEEVLTLRAHNQAVTDVAISPDGHMIASADINGSVFVWNGTPLVHSPVTAQR